MRSRSDNYINFKVWDFDSGKLISNIQWSELIDGQAQKSSLLYSASFSRGNSSPLGPCSNRFIMAGGSDRNEMKIFTSESYRVHIINLNTRRLDQ